MTESRPEMIAGTADAVLPTVVVKSRPEDFRVTEELGFELDGQGEHACFHVRKTNLNTLDVARALAEACQVKVADVGFAGRKDKHAVTEQWYSVPARVDRWPLDMAGVECLSTGRHGRKLRLGSHRANRFDIRLTGVADTVDVTERLSRLAAGFPNFFGSQRLSPGNVEQALVWLTQQARGPGRAPPRRKRRHGGRGRRAWHLSVLRSMLFNEVLAARLVHGSWRTVLDGDVVVDGAPTGPLWGRGRSATGGLAGGIERAALESHGETLAALEYSGLTQDRRALYVVPQQLDAAAVSDDAVQVSFALPPGSYATVLLSAACQLIDQSR